MNVRDLPDAVWSEDKKYRYFLRRQVNTLFGQGAVTFLMLNPSTATEFANDPTVRRCIGFGKTWGKAWLYVVNLSPFRATDPDEMAANGDEPEDVAETNLAHILAAAAESDTVVAAYGCYGTECGRADRIMGAVRATGVQVWCLGQTKQGQPRHPLYVSADRELEVYDVSVSASG